MKVTNKIIISLGGFLAICVFTFLISMRMSMQSASASETAKYNVVSVPTFHSIQIEKDWNIEIVNGENFEVSMGELPDGEKVKANIVVENGVLIFKTNTDKNSRYRFPAKVAVPKLKSIAISDANLTIHGVSFDSFNLDVDDANAYISDSNFSSIVMKNKNGSINCNDTKIELAEVHFTDDAKSHFTAKKIVGEVKGNSSLGLYGAVDSLGVKFGKSARMYKH